MLVAARSPPWSASRPRPVALPRVGAGEVEATSKSKCSAVSSASRALRYRRRRCRSADRHRDRKDSLERVVAGAVQESVNASGSGPRICAVPSPGGRRSTTSARRAALGAQPRDRDRDVVEQAVAARESRPAWWVPPPSSSRCRARTRRRRRRAPTERRPRSTSTSDHGAEPALLAQRHRPVADARQQRAVVDRLQPLPRNRLGLVDDHALGLDAATRRSYLSIGNLCPSGSGMRQRSWLHASTARPAAAAKRRSPAASISAARRSRRRVDAEHNVLGAARPDAAQGRPGGDRGRDDRGPPRPREAASSRPREGIGVGSRQRRRRRAR